MDTALKDTALKDTASKDTALKDTYRGARIILCNAGMPFEIKNVIVEFGRIKLSCKML